MTRAAGRTLPEAVRATLEEFHTHLGVGLRVWRMADGEPVEAVYATGSTTTHGSCGTLYRVAGVTDPEISLDLVATSKDLEPLEASRLGTLAAAQVARAFEYASEVRFFTYELSERYEEINLLYSISETLGSVLNLEDAARAILNEVCDVLAALRGSLWVYQAEEDHLHLVASVGRDGRDKPIDVADAAAVTARVFREGRAVIFGPAKGLGRMPPNIIEDRRATPRGPDTVLSVPIRYTPPTGIPRTVGVINLMGRRTGERFSASDQKLLSAIASQVGAALENNRLVHKTLEQERVSRELELAHNLQMKLLPSVESFDGAEVAARVQPAESVGGDFYHLFHLPDGRLGVLIGDVSSHGFPAALIMALALSAAAIYASEGLGPVDLMDRMDTALRDELESTEMYLTLFYGIIDPETGVLAYANAGHPHAFVVHSEGSHDRLSATAPPMGIAERGSFEERTVPWTSKDDLLLLFTDGLSDHLAFDTRENGEALIVKEVARRRNETPRQIVTELFALSDESEGSIPSDDRTALLLRT